MVFLKLPCSPLQKLWETERELLILLSFDRLVVAVRNRQVIVTNAGYPNDPRKASAES